MKVKNTEEMEATPMTLGEYSERTTWPMAPDADANYKGYMLQHKTVMFPACYHTWVSEYDFNKRFSVVEE